MTEGTGFPPPAAAPPPPVAPPEQPAPAPEPADAEPADAGEQETPEWLTLAYNAAHPHVAHALEKLFHLITKR